MTASAFSRKILGALAALFLAGCADGGGRICRGDDGAVLIVEWDPLFRQILVDGFEFYAHEDFVREIRFEENGNWILRHEQGSMQAKSVADCEGPGSGYSPVVNVWGYQFEADEGEFGAVYHWQEKPRPDLCDANGDGKIPAFVEIAPNWFRHQTPRRFACEREADWIDKILVFVSLLARI